MISKSVMKRNLEKAGVKKMYLRMKLTDLGIKGKSLREYISSNKYLQDRDSGTGLILHGKTDNRLYAFPVMVKEMVLAGDYIKLVSLLDLDTYLNDKGEYLDILNNVSALAVSSFQGGGVCPLAPYPQHRVEQMLTDRVERGLRIYLSSDTPLIGCSWWSDDFKNFMKGKLGGWNFGRS